MWQDRNLGLVRRCLALHRQRRIQRLADVYSALSLGDIAVILELGGADAVQTVHADMVDIVSSLPFGLPFALDFG